MGRKTIHISDRIQLQALILAIFLALSICYAQSGDTLVTWKECVSLALRNNPQLASSNQAIEVSKFSHSSTYNGLFPQINLNQTYGSGNNQNGTALNAANWQTVGSVNLNLLSMPDITNVKTSKTVIDQFQASRQQISTLVRFNLRSAFSQLFYIRKSIEVSRNIVNMRQEEAQLVTLRYNSGRESKGNMLGADAALLQAKADLDQNVRDLRTARQNLCTQIGLEKPTAFDINGTVDNSPAPELPKDEDALLKHRADIILQEAVVVTAEAALSQAKSSLWPDLSVGYSLIGQGLGRLSTFQNSWNIDLSYPLYSKGPTSAYYSISIAKSNLEKARQDLRATREQAILDIETSWSNLTGSLDQSKVQTALLEAARQRNDEANIRYESGLLTYDNWEIIVSDRVSLERSAIQAQLNAAIAEAAWDKALGKRLEE